jgi:hypothetical protein
MLLSVLQANAIIERGAPLVIAGSGEALAALRPGHWIGGSIPYFITAEGGRCDRTRVFVDEITLPVARWSIRSYDAGGLNRLASDAFENGFSYVIIPANSAAHLEYAMHAAEYPDLFMKPVIGWISGVHLDDLAFEAAVAVDGRTGLVQSTEAIVLHVELPPGFQVMVRTVNLFKPGPGPTLRFSEPGFSASSALIEGKPVALVRFIKDQRWDASLPLVADYAGTHVNVSIKSINEKSGRVNFYAPVFPDVDYRRAAPVKDYVAAFSALVPKGIEPVLSCNCILNYVYGKLEGRQTGPFTGPATFGEIAHQLLNQTLVYLAANKTVRQDQR